MLFLKLFFSFAKIGFTSFGGVSMIPLINSQMVSNNWMTSAEVMDIVAIAEMTPGPLGLNCATFAGMRTGGIIGSLCANLGILMPTFTIGVATTLFFEKFKDSRYMQEIMYGVRPVCIGLILSTVMTMGKSSFMPENILDLRLVGIGCVSALLLWRFKCSIPTIICVCGGLGLFLCR